MHHRNVPCMQRLGVGVRPLPAGHAVNAAWICILINHIYGVQLQTENTTITRKQMLKSPVSRSAPSFHRRMSSAGQGSRCWHLSTPNPMTKPQRQTAKCVRRSRPGRQATGRHCGVPCVFDSCVIWACASTTGEPTPAWGVSDRFPVTEIPVITQWETYHSRCYSFLFMSV